MTSSTTSRQLIPPGMIGPSRRHPVEVALELGADLRARAVQQHALVARRELERLRRPPRAPSPRRRAARSPPAGAAGSLAIAARTCSSVSRGEQPLLGLRAQLCGGIAQPPGYIGWSSRRSGRGPRPARPRRRPSQRGERHAARAPAPRACARGWRRSAGSRSSGSSGPRSAPGPAARRATPPARPPPRPPGVRTCVSAIRSISGP